MMTDTDETTATGGLDRDDTAGSTAGDTTSGRSGAATGAPDGAAPSTDSRNLAVAAHLSAFVGLAGIPSFVGPLVVWLLHRERDPFVAEHARQALNFNLSVLIYAGAAVALSVITIGLGLIVTVPAAIAGAIAWLALTVVAAMRAAEGERYRYPLTLDLVS